MSTDLILPEEETTSAPAVSLFAGATPDDVIAAASEVATRFSDIVKRQRLYQRISGRDHVLIEGWQTVGSMVGVFAIKDQGVRELPWPEIASLGSSPPDPGREPPRTAATWADWKVAHDALARWQHHRDKLTARSEGLAFGFTASFHAVKDGRVIGWGEGQADRTEPSKVLDANYALRSMAQTRGQSRALAASLRFIVGLAGYATTPADEMHSDDRVAELESKLAQRERQLAEMSRPVVATLDNAGQEVVTSALEGAWPDLDAVEFITTLERRFGGVIPEDVGVALRAWAWFATRPTPETTAAPPEDSQGSLRPDTSMPADSTTEVEDEQAQVQLEQPQ
jgi:hypothetical protein